MAIFTSFLYVHQRVICDLPCRSAPIDLVLQGSRVAQSDITLRQLKDAAEPRRSPSKPASPRRCPWHGSGAAAVSGAFGVRLRIWFL